MRNLKKILALVLALVMSFSVMTVSSAAFKDQDKINESYAEAVDVLSFLDVFQGYENGKFNPNGKITRAEVAAIIYRVATGNVNDKAEMYADLNTFSDVKADDWFAGYVNYCARAEYVKGNGDGTFNPQGNVTGYQAMAMILRAIGYDQNGEFTGESYTVEVAKVAQARGITKNLKNVTLGAAATREVVAEILFQTIIIPQVTYTLAFGYNTNSSLLQDSAKENDSLAFEIFRLIDEQEVRYDTFGRPYHIWFRDIYYKDLAYNTNREPVLTYYFPVVAEYTTAVCECDLAKDLGIETSYAPYVAYENGTKFSPAYTTAAGQVTYGDCGEFDGIINAVHTSTMVGAQGRLTQVYSTYYGLALVMIDQFAAMVTDVTELILDKNNHVKYPATATLTVFDAANGYSTITWENDEENFEYTKGQFLLINALADKNGNVYDVDNVEVVLGTPATVTGAQTKLTNKDSHIVEGTEYPDAFRLELDQVGTAGDDHVWMFDTYGNIIAIVDLPEAATQYVALTDIKWVENNTDLAAGHALAKVTYMNGEQANIVVTYIDGTTLFGVEGKLTAADEFGAISSTMQYNRARYTNTELYEIGYDAYGRINLIPVAELANACVKNGEPQLAPNFYVGSTTQFLTVSTAYRTYDVYTGIKSIPSDLNDTSKYFAVDENGDRVAEYVFIIDPSFYATNYAPSYFFAHRDAKLTVTTERTPYGLYYTIEGGYVNGELAALTTWDVSVVNALVNYWNNNKADKYDQGKMYSLVLADGDVESVSVITDAETYFGYPMYQYAVYGMKAEDARLIDDVLLTNYGQANEEAYHIDGAAVNSYFRNLKDTVKYDDEAYLYIVYNIKNNNKNAIEIYITDQAGVNFEDALADAIDAVDAAEVELNTAMVALDAYLNGGASEASVDEALAELVKAVEDAKAALEAALANLNSMIAHAEGAEWVGSVAAAETAAAEAEVKVVETDLVLVEVEFSVETAEAIEVVYAVTDDVDAKIVEAVEADVASKLAGDYYVTAAIVEKDGEMITVKVTVKADEKAEDVLFEKEVTVKVTLKLEETEAEA